MKTLLLLLSLLISSYSYGQILTVSATDMTVKTEMDFASPSAGTQTFHISCAATSNWSIYIDYDSWITASNGDPNFEYSGTGPADIAINAIDNDSYTDSRATTIRVNITLTHGSVDRYIEVTQAANIDPILTLSTNTLNLISDGDRDNVSDLTVTSNEDWTTTMDSWITLSSTSGTAGTTSLQVTTKPNDTFVPRTGTVTFTGIAATQTLTINQEAAVPFIKIYSYLLTDVTVDTIKLDNQNVFDFSLAVTSSFKFAVSFSDLSWFTYSPSSTWGSINNYDDLSNIYLKNLLTIRPSVNTTNTERISVLTFYDPYGVTSYTKKIVIAQGSQSLTTATQDAVTSNELNVYPNPSTGTVHVDSKEPMSINVFNATGNIVYTDEPSMTHQIQLQKGLYFLHTESLDYKSVQKVIIE